MGKYYLKVIKPFSCGLSVAIIFILCHLALHKVSPQVASVNVNRLVNEHIQQQLNLSLSEKELQIDNQKFMLSLEKALEQLAKQENLYLIVSDAIVFGPRDVTQAVKQLIGNNL